MSRPKPRPKQTTCPWRCKHWTVLTTVEEVGSQSDGVTHSEGGQHGGSRRRRRWRQHEQGGRRLVLAGDSYRDVAAEQNMPVSTWKARRDWRSHSYRPYKRALRSILLPSRWEDHGSVSALSTKATSLGWAKPVAHASVVNTATRTASLPKLKTLIHNDLKVCPFYWQDVISDRETGKSSCDCAGPYRIVFSMSVPNKHALHKKINTANYSK